MDEVRVGNCGNVFHEKELLQNHKDFREGKFGVLKSKALRIDLYKNIVLVTGIYTIYLFSLCWNDFFGSFFITVSVSHDFHHVSINLGPLSTHNRI